MKRLQLIETNRHLPSEIVEQILLKLPSKSIVRLKTVSKLWNSVITNSSFIQGHVSLVKSTPAISSALGHSLLIVERHSIREPHANIKLLHDKQVTEIDHAPKFTYQQYRTTKPFIDDPEESKFDTQVSGPINGIYLVHIFTLDSTYGVLVLWSPGVRQSHVLPSLPLPPFIAQRDDVLDLESDGFCASVLGFDSSANDYKVVAICSYGHRFGSPLCLACICVYSLLTNSWKSIDLLEAFVLHTDLVEISTDGLAGLCGPTSARPENVIQLHGLCHWSLLDLFLNDEDGHVVLSFNLKNEVFQVLEIPEALRNDHITSVDNCLAVVSKVKDSLITVFDVWIMREYGVDKSWSKVYRIPISRPRCCWINIVDDRLLLSENCGVTGNTRIVSYSLHDHNDKHILSYYGRWYSDVFPYHESLVHVKLH